MTLQAGTRLGPYEILSPIGAGGMGEVYRARDTRLGREVAIKVLSGRAAPSPEARQRFEREAKVISQLSHPHICALYDVGREGETEYLVMELLEGETLARRLAAGPLPLEQALRLATQIADALSSAHRQGVVHRDLKPDNVMLTKTGLKLLDFGLAKPVVLEAPSDLTSSPTVAAASGNVTREGTILGTLLYMAPEQLEGRESDARTDIFAFGAVLYEMLTGRKAFSRPSQASVIAAILKEEPATVSSLQPIAPVALDRLVRTCLAKDPEERWQDARDLANELRWIAEGGSQPAIAATVSGQRTRGARIALASAVVAGIVATAFAVRSLSPKPQPARAVTTSILPPLDAFFDSVEGTWMALSPDATRLVFRAFSGDRSRLWVRPLNSLTSRPLTGTDGGLFPAWSPDGGWIAFMVERKLKKVDVSNGTVQTICEFTRRGASGEDIPKGIDWSRDGVIVFAPSARDGLYRVPASGGTAEKLTELDTAGGEISHRCPAFLPDGRHFLYVALTTSRDAEPYAIYVGSLDSRERRLLRKVDAWGRLAFSPVGGGYLTFIDRRSLMAQPFDPNGLRLSGEPTRLLEALDAPVFAVSGDTLAALDYLPRVLQLSWLERASGKLSPIGVKPFPLEGGRLSHDGTRLATIVVDRVTGNKDIWVIDLSRGVSTRLSSSTGEQPLDPIWSADDSKIAYASQHDTWTDIRTRNASGTGEEEVLFSHGTSYILPVDWSSDGKSIAVAEYGKDGQHWRMSVLAVAKRAEKELWSGLGEAFPGTISPGALSPDGRFFAYCNEESGRSEVYVESIGHGGGRRQVSISGGSFPIFWSRDGKEILFVSPDGSQAMAAGVRTDPGLGTTPPRPVADVASISALAGVSSDGKKWLVASESGNKRPDTITLVQNWVAGLRR